VEWLTRHAEGEATHHLPGWRPELAAEGVQCDYTGSPSAPVGKVGTSASEFPLGEAITADRIVEECATGTDATRSTGIDLTGQGTLCKSVSTKSIGVASTPIAKVVTVEVTEPTVIFSGDSCEASGYQSPPPDFVSAIEQHRRVEMLLRAVPRRCPRVDEARAWVERQIKTLPDEWTVDIAQVSGGGCALPQVDWMTHRIST